MEAQGVTECPPCPTPKDCYCEAMLAGQQESEAKVEDEYDTQMEEAYQDVLNTFGSTAHGDAPAALRAFARAALSSSCMVYERACFKGCAEAKTPGGKCFYHDIHARIDRLGT